VRRLLVLTIAVMLAPPGVAGAHARHHRHRTHAARRHHVRAVHARRRGTAKRIGTVAPGGNNSVDGATPPPPPVPVAAEAEQCVEAEGTELCWQPTTEEQAELQQWPVVAEEEG
jgi:hypothetical protein